MTLASLSEAIDWTRDRWSNQRTAPMRLHVREEEGTGLIHDPQRPNCPCLACTPGPSDRGLGSHAFSGAFAAALDGKANASVAMTGPESCYHPLLGRGQPARECPECHGMGAKDHRTDRYLFPMTLALDKLCNGLGWAHHPHPYRLVVTLASHGWDWHAAAAAVGRSPEVAEALFLMSIRKLQSFYSEGPHRTATSAGGSGKWTEYSDSQRAAIEDGETAA